MIIKGGKVFQEDGSFLEQALYINDHRLVDKAEHQDDEKVIDAEGLLVLPGLVDIHSHGAAGEDFSDGNPEGLKKILQYEKRCGITSYCPTSMTFPKERLRQIFASIKGAQTEEEAKVVGINMEGPFLDPAKKGAHVEEWIAAPDAAFVRELNQDVDGLVRLVTLAPNMDGAEEFIKEMHEEVCISLGHTAADYDCASRAMKLGAHHVTHLYNAMQPFGHRAPGLIGAAMDDPECMVELICDGYHIHPSAIRAAFRMFGPERVILISDSMRATGMENGTYELGGQEVTVKDRKAVLKDGTLAGSATNLYGCMCKAVEFGIPLEQAIMAVTANPARSIGIFDPRPQRLRQRAGHGGHRRDRDPLAVRQCLSRRVGDRRRDLPGGLHRRRGRLPPALRRGGWQARHPALPLADLRLHGPAEEDPDRLPAEDADARCHHRRDRLRRRGAARRADQRSERHHHER